MLHCSRRWLSSVLLLLLVAGCRGASRQPGSPSEEQATPFVFQALNLSQRDASGRVLWRVRSPEARYDLSRRMALASGIQGEINQQGQLLYRLSAPLGTVLNDGEVIQLEGPILIERRGAQPVTIRASRMRWYPRQQRIQLDRQAEAEDPTLRLRAQQATLLLDRDLLQLRGEPQINSRQPLTAGTGPLQLRVQALDWSPGRGDLRASGQAVASQEAGSGPPRTLRAAGLHGNTLRQSLVLEGPVRLDMPDRRAWLQAGTSVLDFATSRLTSGTAFSAAVASLRIQGRALQLDLGQENASILQGCRLVQPDAQLTASRCSWNWRNDRVLATGGVVLERSDSRQTTRASQLNGRLGPSGSLQFSSPGSRVRSTLILPPGSAQAGKRPAL